MSDLVARWINQLKVLGKSEKDINDLLASLIAASSINLHTILYATLDVNDFEVIEGVADEAEASKKAEELFLQKTGITLDDLAEDLLGKTINQASSNA